MPICLLIIVIGIIMPQLNVLPASTSQNIELKDEKSSIDSITSKDDFSKYIDLYLTNNKESSSKRKVDDIKHEAEVAKDNSSLADAKMTSKNTGDLAETSESSDELDSVTHEQKVAASGNEKQIKSNQIDQKVLDESEQLMSFLTKADNTLLNHSVNTTAFSPEQLSSEQKAHYEAQLLLNTSNLVADLSAVAKALGNDQTNVSLTPTASEQVISTEESLLSEMTEDASEKGTKVKLSDELIIENKSKDNKQAEASLPLVKSAENKTVLSALGSETRTLKVSANNSEARVSHVNDDKTNTVLSEAKVEPTIGAKVNHAIDHKTNTVLSEAKVESIIDAKVNHAKDNKTNTVNSEVKAESITDVKTNVTQKVSNEGVSVDALIDREFISKKSEVGSLASELKEAKQINSDQIQRSNDKAAQTSIAKEVVQGRDVELLRSSQLSNNEQNESNNKKQIPAETVKPFDKIIETQVNASKENQSDKLSILSESQKAKTTISQPSETIMSAEKATQAGEQLNKNTLSNNRSVTNQSVTNDLMQESVNKTQVKDNDKIHLSSVLVEQVEQKPIGAFTEEKIIEKDRVSSPTNPHVIDINGNSMRTPQEIIEQQSVEMLNPSVTTEVSQNQKTNVQLHQETISMFRKDFTEAVKDKVMLMISQKLQQFDITLDPPELGNMQVRVNLQGEQAAVNFIVQSQQTKDALEQNMHKLRELLAEQGVDVGDANVEQQSQQSSNEEAFTAENLNELGSEIENSVDDNDIVTHTLSEKMINSSAATVDYYA